MQKMTPHLWFDKEAKEAAEFYTSVFPNSRITNITTLHEFSPKTVQPMVVHRSLLKHDLLRVH